LGLFSLNSIEKPLSPDGDECQEPALLGDDVISQSLEYIHGYRLKRIVLTKNEQ
jgi:hypothetical protein